MKNYLETVLDVYRAAAEQPEAKLCCTSSAVWRLPDLHIPPSMLEMNYGCGAAVDPRELQAEDTVLYVGVGGGLEALQLAYFTRRPGSVIAVDPVAAMREKAKANFQEAARLNVWFQPEFVQVLDGTALQLPVASSSVSVVGQNCLFNVFEQEDLQRALSETVRALRFGGRFMTSDPITPAPLPAELTGNTLLRARCISGCQTLEEFMQTLIAAGFGRVDVRGRTPYRWLDPREFTVLHEGVLLESLEVTAWKVPDGPDGPAVFAGRTAIYAGPDETLDDGNGTMLPRGIPVPISEAAAKRLTKVRDVVVTPPTWHSRGGGCC